MKKIIKTYLGIAFALFLAVSCDTENKSAMYTPEGTDTGVSFLSSTSGDTEINSKAAKFDITVGRSKCDQAATVKITGTLPDGITAPATISFEKGKSETMLSLDISKMEIGKTYKGTVTFADETEYNGKIAITSNTFTLAKAYTWTPIGTGEWFDGLALQISDSDLNIVKVDVLKAEGFNRWRIMNPYPKDKVVLAWDEDSFVGGANDYIEFYTLDEAKGTIKFDQKIYCGLNYEKKGKIVYTYPSSYSATYAEKDADNKFVDAQHVQFYVPRLIDGTTSWFNFGYMYLGMPGSGDLAKWLAED